MARLTSISSLVSIFCLVIPLAHARTPERPPHREEQESRTRLENDVKVVIRKILDHADNLPSAPMNPSQARFLILDTLQALGFPLPEDPGPLIKVGSKGFAGLLVRSIRPGDRTRAQTVLSQWKQETIGPRPQDGSGHLSGREAMHGARTYRVQEHDGRFEGPATTHASRNKDVEPSRNRGAPLSTPSAVDPTWDLRGIEAKLQRSRQMIEQARNSLQETPVRM